MNDVLHLLRKLEQGINRGGWDQPPRFGTLRRHAYGLGFGDDLPLPDGNAGHNLALLADAMDDRHPATLIFAEVTARIPGFYGLALFYEAWGNSEVGPSTMRTRSLADIVGSQEMRGGYAMTIDAKAYQLIRIRGEKPKVYEDETPGGRVPRAMLRILRTVAEYLPDDRVDRDALAALHVLDDDEMETRWLETQFNRSAT